MLLLALLNVTCKEKTPSRSQHRKGHQHQPTGGNYQARHDTYNDQQ
jgi:hypothetical protein